MPSAHNPQFRTCIRHFLLSDYQNRPWPNARRRVSGQRGGYDSVVLTDTWLPEVRSSISTPGGLSDAHLSPSPNNNLLDATLEPPALLK